MNSMVAVAICAMFITSSEADIQQDSLPKNLGHRLLLENIKDACFLMGLANYSATALDLYSPGIGGCVHYNHKKTDGDTSKTFTLWLGKWQQGKQKCAEEEMEQIIFSCEEFFKTSMANTNDGTKFVRLYGRDTNKKQGVQSIRCALFKKDKTKSKNFYLAVSGNNTCDGLANAFTEIHPPVVPKGSHFLMLTRYPEYQEHESRNRRSVKNSTSTIQNQDWFTVWILG